MEARPHDPSPADRTFDFREPERRGLVSNRNLPTFGYIPFQTFSATGSRTVQPGPVDIHAHARADPAVHVPGHRVPLGHADLLERETGVHRTADRAHAQVLLLGGEPEEQERDRAERPG